MSLRSPFKPGVTTAVAAFASLAAVVGTINYLDIGSLLQQRKKSRKVDPRLYSLEDANKPSLAAFRTLTSQITLNETYPLASKISKNVPMYNANTFKLDNADFVSRLQDELYHILLHGPGVYVIKHLQTNIDVIDRANEAYAAIIRRELKENGEKGDHFASEGTNSRIWNSFSKHCFENPENFVTYYSDPLFKLVCDAWLGPDYRITAQVNVVKPGGKAQMSHRDYHLGFQTAEQVAKWPKAMHTASQLLTLQGAVAHTDMPVESGPTRLLPFSQMFEEGFMAYRLPEFNNYFLENHVSLPLEKGDAMFFNPALFHAAGENRTKDFERSANLIQVSSAFGKTMETIDSLPLIDRTYDLVKAKYQAEGMSAEVDAFVRAVGEGYPFPTNLDRRPPASGGMAPESEQDVLRRALSQGWEHDRVMRELTSLRKDSQA